MDYEENKKWAIISQFTTIGWFIAVIATLKKKRNRLLNCYLNNGVVICVYGFVSAEVTTLLKNFYNNLDLPVGPMAPKINYYIVAFLPYIYYILMILIEGIYVYMVLGGIYFSIKAQARRIPYIFQMKSMEKINIFKGDEDEEEDGSNDDGYQSENSDDIKSSFSEAVRSIGKAASDFASEVSKSSSRKKTCPSCGKEIMEDDVFCTYCGATVPKEKAKKQDNTRITVADYISRIKDYTCDKCGEKVTGSDKFCPGCGEPVIIKIMPKSCPKCGKKFADDYDFCPGCGANVERIELQTKCKQCGSDLLFGKDFCVNCGTKVR